MLAWLFSHSPLVVSQLRRACSGSAAPSPAPTPAATSAPAAAIVVATPAPAVAATATPVGLGNTQGEGRKRRMRRILSLQRLPTCQALSATDAKVCWVGAFWLLGCACQTPSRKHFGGKIASSLWRGKNMQNARGLTINGSCSFAFWERRTSRSTHSLLDRGNLHRFSCKGRPRVRVRAVASLQPRYRDVKVHLAVKHALVCFFCRSCRQTK